MSNKKYYILSSIFWGLVVLISYKWYTHFVSEKIYNQATDRSQFVFKMVESARLWNARHGGVYALITKDTQPNPYLKIEHRDINSTDGLELTMINPAYMTRQLIDVVTELSDLRLHITSEKLMNPANKADEWEIEQLHKFAKGVASYGEFLQQDSKNIFRYMQPLTINQSCLKCHSHQNYKLGDIRGGLSVSFDAKALLDLESIQIKKVAIIHLVAWILLSALTSLFIKIFIKNMNNLAQEKSKIESEVREKTKELQIFSHAIQYSPITIVITDIDGNIEYVNPKFCQTTGYSMEEIIGKNPKILQSGKISKEIYEKLWETILSKKEWQGELINKTKDGVEYNEYARISPILNEKGEIIKFIAIKEDITQRKLSQERTLHQARHDELTGLINRRYFNELLLEYIKQPIVLMYLDLDGFKNVNDTLGHDIGDILLQEVALRLKQVTRSSDLVARLGGDEFVIVMKSGVTLDGAKELASKIIETLRTPFYINQNEIKISTSIGIAFSKESQTPQELIKDADKAMYNIKESSRDGYEII